MKSALLAPAVNANRNDWWLIGLSLSILYVPTYWGLAHTIWQTEDQFHGAIILLIVMWLLFSSRDRWFYAPCENLRPGWGGILLGTGLILYILGRSQDILLCEVGSQIPVFSGVILLMQGKNSLKSIWFPILYLAFMVPLPGILIDTLTGPLKQWVSLSVAKLLYMADYPIARQGVVLMIGQYQLLIANACSGLNSMLSLSAMGLLFIYLMSRKNMVYNLLMSLSIVPIAIFANILRVAALVLITYYFGDEAGQGFMHGFSGIVLFVGALSAFFLLDLFLSKTLRLIHRL